MLLYFPLLLIVGFFLHFRSKKHFSVVWFGLISFRSFFYIILLEFITSNQCKHQMGVLINKCSSSEHTISASIRNKYAKISKIIQYNEPIYHFRWKFHRLDFVSMHWVHLKSHRMKHYTSTWFWNKWKTILLDKYALSSFISNIYNNQLDANESIFIWNSILANERKRKRESPLN